MGSGDASPDVLDRVVHVSGCAHTVSMLTKLLSSLLPLTLLLHRDFLNVSDGLEPQLDFTQGSHVDLTGCLPVVGRRRWQR